MRCRRLYRPENTSMEKDDLEKVDYNEVLWSDDLILHDCNGIRGKCFLR